MLDNAFQPSSYMTRSTELISTYKNTINALKKLCRGKTVNPKFFGDQSNRDGFLSCFLRCLIDMGFNDFGEHVKPELSNLRLPLSQFAKAIVDMRIVDLRKLSRIHHYIENSKSEGSSFPKEFKGIAGFFEKTKRSSDDTAEAGKFILSVSSMAQVTLELKEQMFEFSDIMEDFNEIQNRTHTDDINYKGLIELDTARHTVDYLILHLRDEVITIEEVCRMQAELNSLQQGFLETVIRFGKCFDDRCGGQIHSANRNIKTWFQWEMMSEEEKKNKRDQFGASFQIRFDEFKNGIEDHIITLNHLSQNILSSIQNKQRVSSYFLNIIHDIDDLISEIIKCNINMDMSLRKKLRELVAIVSKTKIELKKSIEEEKNQLKALPEIIRNRIQYFNQEVPEVLSRSNTKEIRLLILAINTSYQSIEKKLKKSIKTDSNGDIDKICKLVKTRYSEIVRNSTSLIKSA